MIPSTLTSSPSDRNAVGTGLLRSDGDSAKESVGLPRLDARLKAVASSIRWRIHADIGSDHGHLLRALISAGRIEFGIAIENKRQPWEHSRQTLAGVAASVRFADGLAGLTPGEADGLSICGMGGREIVRILQAYPDRIPAAVVLQPNCHAELVRRWALNAGFRLVDELEVGSSRIFDVLCFQHHDDFTDPSYAGLDHEVAILLGPHHLRRRHNDWIRRLQQELAYWNTKAALNDAAVHRVRVLNHVLNQK